MGIFLIIWRKYKNLIVFLILECIAIGFLLTFNVYQNSYFFRVSTTVRSDFLNTISAIDDYFRLKVENEKLVEENRILLEKLRNTETLTIDNCEIIEKYEYKTAKVRYGTIGLPENYLVIDKGRKNGITPELAVTSANGLVGIVYAVTDDYASVIPLVNTSFSCLVSTRNHTLTASTSWDGKDYRFIYVKGVPLHIKVQEHDSIFTNKNSTLYPPNELIGTVISLKKDDLGRSYTLKVKLANDFSTLQNVYIVKNLEKQQIDSLLTNE